ncbi:MAG: RecX family transcriptional regulator [Solirubrobacterales bacterium]|nr:RecX family transcriptional regulator [Solirubrobacterales bacterium]
MADETIAKALTALGRKALTEAEMRDWLLAREVEPEEVERVVEFLTENLALDDRRFALEFTNDKRDLAGWGRDRIRATLLRRGIDRRLVEEAINAPGAESEVDRAVRLLIERGAQLDDDRGRNRALGLLARRGYDADEAYAAIRIAGRVN